MNRIREITWSPLMRFLILLLSIEVLYRLPFILIYQRTLPFDSFILFSTYEPIDVITYGLLISVIGFVAFFVSHQVLNSRGSAFRKRASRHRIIELHWMFFVVVLVLILCCISAAFLIGISEILDDISKKRNITGDDQGILLYIIFKLSLFLHIPGFIMLGWFYSKPKRHRLVAFVLVSTVVMVTAFIFSQRQVIILYFFELVYVSLLFGKFNKRMALKSGVVLLVFLITITTARSAVQGMTIFDSLNLFNLKIITSRYFLDFTRHGTIWLWHAQSVINTDLILGYLFEIFLPNETYTSKEFGYDIASNVYWLYNPGGVTTGAILDAMVQFGFFFGFLFVAAFAYYFFWLENKLFSDGFSIVHLFLLCKVVIFLNSSFDSFLFATVIEFPVLLIFISLVKIKELTLR